MTALYGVVFCHVDFAYNQQIIGEVFLFLKGRLKKIGFFV